MSGDVRPGEDGMPPPGYAYEVDMPEQHADVEKVISPTWMRQSTSFDGTHYALAAMKGPETVLCKHLTEVLAMRGPVFKKPKDAPKRPGDPPFLALRRYLVNDRLEPLSTVSAAAVTRMPETTYTQHWPILWEIGFLSLVPIEDIKKRVEVFQNFKKPPEISGESRSPLESERKGKTRGEDKKDREDNSLGLQVEQEGRWIAEALAQCILKRMPKLVQLQEANMKRTISRWSKECAKMQKAGNRTDAEIKRVLTYLATDKADFMGKIVLSPTKLEKHFDRLELDSRQINGREKLPPPDNSAVEEAIR